ncbi:MULTISPECIES: ComEA family DNA-binding protein [Comamonas]|uniref:ComEA family DNA-binding protein n=1 Tax=Comamonas TaxID=283 RepID=UPI00257BBE4D|nr:MULTISPECIES: helix-hairpin-helix domain-containing protein [Comamonas]
MIKKLIAICLAFYAALAMAAVDVNKASHSDLQEVKGIGPATATRIMDARKQGPFKNWDDLIARVKGIAATSANKLSDEGLTVNGQAYKQGGKSATKPAGNNEKTAKPAQTAGKKQEKS